ncbi:hypothetical protein [Aestuariivirga sp.]|uniref:hypothetical protein n=1 Tax=Aestuariivirga sp. TaxID=2650926 RepID=UPI00391C3171
MLKQLMIAGGIVAAALALSPTADAHTRTGVSIHFGVPFYTYRVGPGWRYYDGYGWYDYRRHGDFRRNFQKRLTCNQARRLVDRSGYDDVRVRECNGRTYTFRADRRGRTVTVYVNSRTGAIWRG